MILRRKNIGTLLNRKHSSMPGTMAGKNLRSMREESESKIVLIGASSPGQDDNFGGKVQEGSVFFLLESLVQVTCISGGKKRVRLRADSFKNFRSVESLLQHQHLLCGGETAGFDAVDIHAARYLLAIRILAVPCCSVPTGSV